jgi:hypothetical protein
MIKAIEAAVITKMAQKREADGISEEMKEFIGAQILKAAKLGQTRTGFTFGGDTEYCLLVAHWAKQFGYSAWFDYSHAPAVLWLGWNAQMKTLN